VAVGDTPPLLEIQPAILTRENDLRGWVMDLYLGLVKTLLRFALRLPCASIFESVVRFLAGGTVA
jgi:hypothetical protein